MTFFLLFYFFYLFFSAFIGATSPRVWAVSLVKPPSLYYMKCHLISWLHSHFKCAKQGQIKQENTKRVNLSTPAEFFSPNFAFSSVGVAVSRLCCLQRLCCSCRNSDCVPAALGGTHQIEPFIHFPACLHFPRAVWVGILSGFIFAAIEQNPRQYSCSLQAAFPRGNAMHFSDLTGNTELIAWQLFQCWLWVSYHISLTSIQVFVQKGKFGEEFSSNMLRNILVVAAITHI